MKNYSITTYLERILFSFESNNPWSVGDDDGYEFYKTIKDIPYVSDDSCFAFDGFVEEYRTTSIRDNKLYEYLYLLSTKELIELQNTLKCKYIKRIRKEKLNGIK